MNKAILTGNFMPYSAAFSRTPIYDRIVQRLPSVTIYELSPSNIVSTILSNLKALLSNFEISSSKDEYTNIETIFSNAVKDDKKNIKTYTVTDYAEGKTRLARSPEKPLNDPLPWAIKLLFATFASDVKNQYNLKLMTSPDITINTDAGWRESFSVMDKIASKGDALLSFGLSKIFDTEKEKSTIVSSIGSFLSMLGVDVQIGPIFDIKTINKNKPSFRFSTYLINDSQESAKLNKEVIRNLFIESLPGAQSVFRFKPGNLFNIAVQVGIGENDAIGGTYKTQVMPIKKLFLCTGKFVLTPIGIYRDGVTPEIYKIDLNFDSLLPDYMNLQMVDFEDRSKAGTSLFTFKNLERVETQPAGVLHEFKRIDDMSSAELYDELRILYPKILNTPDGGIVNTLLRERQNAILEELKKRNLPTGIIS